MARPPEGTRVWCRLISTPRLLSDYQTSNWICSLLQRRQSSMSMNILYSISCEQTEKHDICAYKAVWHNASVSRQLVGCTDCGTLKCENGAICGKVDRCEEISTLNVKIDAICEREL